MAATPTPSPTTAWAIGCGTVLRPERSEGDDQRRPAELHPGHRRWPDASAFGRGQRLPVRHRAHRPGADRRLAVPPVGCLGECEAGRSSSEA